MRNSIDEETLIMSDRIRGIGWTVGNCKIKACREKTVLALALVLGQGLSSH
jgi:hypothetical protein